MSEKLPQPNSEEDLFKWAEEHVKPKKVDDGLGWACPQCELYGRLCPNCSAKQIEEANTLVELTGHNRKPNDEIPLEEFIAGLNELTRKIQEIPDSQDKRRAS